jgi:hypothetical protein
MSYLGTLVDTPSVAAVPRTVEPAWEQHVETEPSPAPASAPVLAAPAQCPIAAEVRPYEPPQAEPAASVEDALRAAFEWVSLRSIFPSTTAEATLSSPTRSAPLKIRRPSHEAPMEVAQTSEPLLVSPTFQQHERAIAPPMLAQPVERIEVRDASSETIGLTTFQSTPALALQLHRTIATPPPPSREAASAAEHDTPARPSDVQVRIDSISLIVRTPTPHVAPPAAEHPSSGAAFAFSARRHHLRWN